MGNIARPGNSNAPPPRFIEGRTDELRELFGTPLPAFPESPESTGDQPAFLVQLHPGLQLAFLKFLDATYYSLVESAGKTPKFQEAEREYFELLLRITINIIENERRSGLLNLFWLAHSKEVSSTVQEHFSQRGIAPYVKYQMHPLMRGFYRLVHRSMWQHFTNTAPQMLEYNLGVPFNHRLIESLFEDQLPLTQTELPLEHLEGVLLPQNRRFRLSREEYSHLRTILRDRIRQGIKKQEPTLLDLLKTQLPSLDPSTYYDDAVELKMIFHPVVVTYLFADYDQILRRLSASVPLKTGRDRRGGWHLLLHDYLDLIQAVRRFEVIHHLRSDIALIPPGVEVQLKERAAEGRLFHFFESSEIVNSARKVTIVFADLRGFTAASEGGISEVELTRSLYTVFDPVADIVKRFGGRIDKFTGDGVMITFGATQVSPDDEMNALRTAVAIQTMFRELQKRGETPYQMGISLHTGRAQIGRFLSDEESVDVTVIGRHVNIASRVTGSGSRPWEVEDEGPTERPHSEQGVWIDEQGVLYNLGIAATPEHVEALRRSAPWEIEERQSGARYTCFDPELQKKLLIEYVGDAKFKGVKRAQPIYRVVAS